MDDNLLERAWSLHLQGRFHEANSLLEPQILKYRTDAEFYRILGLSCLRLGDWPGGETYLARSLQLEPQDRQQVELALVAVAMKKRDASEAVRLTLAVLDRNPRCRPARKALAGLRKALASSGGAVNFQAADWSPLLPRVRRFRNRRSSRILVGGLIALVGLGAVTVGVWWGSQWVNAIPRASERVVTRPGMTDLTGSDPSPEVGQTNVATSRLTLTPDEVRQTLNKVQKLFQEYQDSACRLEINRILLSNASEASKSRVRSLIAYLHAPDFARPESSVNYQDVRGFPELYEGCTVEWTGVISHLNSGTQSITFDLLLGYQEGQSVEGIIPVRLGFASLLKNSQVVVVLGQVVVSNGTWSVEGRGIHAIGYRAP